MFSLSSSKRQIKRFHVSGGECLSSPIFATSPLRLGGGTSEFGARLRQVARRTGLLKAKVVAMLSDGAPWIRISCEEILAGRKVIFILDVFHALTCVAAAQALTPDKSERKLRMDWIKEQLNAGRVAQVIVALKPHGDRSEAVAACIRTYETNADRADAECATISAGSWDCRSDPASWRAPASKIVSSRFKQAVCHLSKAEANALLAVKCCLKNSRWTDVLEWRACSAATA